MTKINEVLDVTLSCINEHNWSGACFATSAINFILLSELGIKSELCLGVFSSTSEDIFGIAKLRQYDHAWLEIDDRVYDVAITSGLHINFPRSIVPIEGIRGNPPSCFKYGVNVDLDDGLYETISPLSNFMAMSPSFSSITYWELASILGKKIDLELDSKYLKSKYSKIPWVHKVPA